MGHRTQASIYWVPMAQRNCRLALNLPALVGAAVVGYYDLKSACKAERYSKFLQVNEYTKD